MKLILGTAQFSDDYGAFKKNKINNKNYNMIFEILDNEKIFYLDTANAYKKSEKIIGNYSKKNYRIFSKLSFSKKVDPKNLRIFIHKQLKHSLNKLKAKNLFCLYIHHVKDLKKYGQKLVDIFLDLKKKKLIKKIGISVYSPDDIKLTLKYFKPDFIQFPFSIFDQRILERNFLKKLKLLNINLVARSCFLQGLLLNNNFEHIKFKLPDKKKISEYHDFCEKKSLNKLDLCLNFVKAFTEIDYLLVGCDNSEQLKEIIKIIKNKNKNKNNKFFFKKFSIKSSEIINPSLWNYA